MAKVMPRVGSSQMTRIHSQFENSINYRINVICMPIVMFCLVFQRFGYHCRETDGSVFIDNILGSAVKLCRIDSIWNSFRTSKSIVLSSEPGDSGKGEGGFREISDLIDGLRPPLLWVYLWELEGEMGKWACWNRELSRSDKSSSVWHLTTTI